MLFRHRNLLSKSSKLTIAIAGAGIGVAAVASSVAVVTWPASAAPGAATATAYLPGVSGTAAANAVRTREQLQSFRTTAVWQAQLAAAASAERAADARQAAAREAAADQAARAAARRAAALAAQQQAQPAQQAQPSAAAPAPPAPPVSAGSAQQIAMSMLGSYGWSSGQFSCLNALWARESGWNVTAANPDGAYGIPQAMPGSKMASAGPNWQTDAATQIRWGLGYIKGLYGSPCGAWAHSQATGWY
jgi:hypothetical protein